MSLRFSLPAPLMVGLLLLTMAAGPSAAQSCCGPITRDGRRMTMMLDATGVDHLWIAGHHIDWSTGAPDEGRPDGREAATHCSAFVAAIGARLGAYVLRPPEHAQQLLASAQMRWLRSEGSRHGWRTLPDAVAAQQAANHGDLVLEAFENPNPHRAGHIAIVRPGDETLTRLNSDGPLETQAGAYNAISTTTAAGFGQHSGAWIPGGAGSIGYYAHAIDWKAMK